MAMSNYLLGYELYTTKRTTTGVVFEFHGPTFGANENTHIVNGLMAVTFDGTHTGTQTHAGPVNLQSVEFLSAFLTNKY